ncbi:SUN domain-containing protein 1-like isoform X1 [Leptopilina heterotoma]|uniref:SUN domain-containing protein 1-like isoform X1 n=2 Tax=Leptopilina heterotoma TaxID=63436 RepID=UPI001CA823B1|nr:SUN domain-containing protein 1-like isoform X1 [Leptopilina heterotoma]
MCRIRQGILILELWLLLKMRKLLYFFLKWLNPILKISSLMALGAGLLFIYAFFNVKDEILPFSEKFDCRKNDNCKYSEVPDISKLCSSPMEKELLRLKTKTFSLEKMLQKLRLHLGRFYPCEHKEFNEMADFAAEAVGGCVIDTPDTETYYPVTLTFYGIPLWKPIYHTPRKIIQPWTEAGECWAFKGSCGKFIIELARAAVISHVTLENIPVSASITGSIDSAPKKFSIYGDFQNEFVYIDSFTYNIHGSPSQTFAVKNSEISQSPFKRIQLEIHSNWGNPEYTCVYRFKVHGQQFDYYT